MGKHRVAFCFAGLGSRLVMFWVKVGLRVCIGYSYGYGYGHSYSYSRGTVELMVGVTVTARVNTDYRQG